MQDPVPATAAEIASIRRRYLWMATSVFFLDLAITLIFLPQGLFGRKSTDRV